MGKGLIVATAEMGLGHLRAAQPFSVAAGSRMVIMGKNDESTHAEKKLWQRMLNGYERVSRYKSIPVLGPIVFAGMNALLSIPKRETVLRDCSRPTIPLKMVERAIKNGLCSGIIGVVQREEQPVLATFYAPALALSQQTDVPVFCQICDSDLSRAWVPSNPTQNNLYYFAPCERAQQRLVSYGVNPTSIFLTGFPFPHQLVGGYQEPLARKNWAQRYDFLTKAHPKSQSRPFHVVYAVGGAGAYWEIGVQIAQSLYHEITQGNVRLTLIAGTRPDIAAKYMSVKRSLMVSNEGIDVFYSSSYDEYFDGFAKIMETADVLWTKPSELSFYSALGIPIVMAPPLGPQEEANREWLLGFGGATDQRDPSTCNVWLLNQLYSGSLARLAKNGWGLGKRTALYEALDIINATANQSLAIAPTLKPECMEFTQI